MWEKNELIRLNWFFWKSALLQIWKQSGKTSHRLRHYICNVENQQRINVQKTWNAYTIQYERANKSIENWSKGANKKYTERGTQMVNILMKICSTLLESEKQKLKKKKSKFVNIKSSQGCR